MSNISPNSLFHFTPKLDYLVEILRNGFAPRYFHEKLLLNESRAIRGHDFGIPMVCFCDISLAQINGHVKSYGNYGIGMTKEWAIKNGLNPVIYLNQESLLSHPMSNICESAIKLNDLPYPEIQCLTGQILSSWLTLQMYSKPYSASFIHRGKRYDNKRFYDEKEWRYIPTENNATAIHGGLSREKMSDKVALAKENQKLKSFSLHFDPCDVKYIFVKEERHIHKIVNELRKMNGQGYDSKTIDLIASKILTTRNLREDF